MPPRDPGSHYMQYPDGVRTQLFVSSLRGSIRSRAFAKFQSELIAYSTNQTGTSGALDVHVQSEGPTIISKHSRDPNETHNTF